MKNSGIIENIKNKLGLYNETMCELTVGIILMTLIAWNCRRFCISGQRSFLRESADWICGGHAAGGAYVCDHQPLSGYVS